MTDQEAEEPGFFKRLHARAHRHPVTSAMTKVVVTIIGLCVLIAGLIMMVTPGPGIVGIILGLAILAAEWPAAERILAYARRKAHEAAEKARELDPAVRRRRILLTLLTCVAVVGLVAAYVWYYDWPIWSVTGWDHVQSLWRVIPELPGM